MKPYTIALAACLLPACAGLSRAERVKYGLEVMRGTCALYETYPTEVPRQPELDEACPVLSLAGVEAE